jgi:hypothetical protein
MLIVQETVRAFLRHEGADLLRERRRSESNRRIEVLQTSALPLGYGARGSKAHQKGSLHQVCRASEHPLIVGG